MATLVILMADFTLIGNQLKKIDNVTTEPIATEPIPGEKINEDFSIDTGWNKDTGWIISNGKANVNSTSLSNEWLTQPGILTIGKTYTATITISNYKSGSIGTDSWYPNYSDPGYVSSNGVHAIEFTAAKTDFALMATADTILSIDNVSVVESNSLVTTIDTPDEIVNESVQNEPTPIITSDSEYSIIPGLYGFGTNTRAAYGGNIKPIILHVNTLASGVSNTDSTHGSFEWAVTRDYPRIVVFDVSGVINCQDYLLITNPYITIAGQTAPAPIVFNGELRLATHDVLIQHFAIRNTHNIKDRDAFSITAYQGPNYNIVIDHCSASWATDENMQVWTSQTSNLGVSDVTFSNCLVAEGIYDHACGFINSGRNIAMIGSIFANNGNRHPFVKVGSETVFWNNLIYNYTYRVAQVSGDYDYSNDPGKLDFRGNVSKAGPDSGSATSYPLVEIMSDFNNNKLQLFMEDNIRAGSLKSGFDVLNSAGISGYERTSSPLALPTKFSPYAASLTYNSVLANAGARPAQRDAVDSRIINEIRTGTGGGKITSPRSMPNYSVINKAFVPVANPHGMYDAYYTNIEHQLHLIANTLEK